MKKEITFKTCSWMHKVIMLSCLMLASGRLFAQHQCNAYFQSHQDTAANTINFFNGQNPPNTQYSWTFGDGGTATGQNPTYTYATPGTYYVCLTVSDSGVCTQTHCDSVRVQGPPPPPTCNARFTAQASQHSGAICFNVQGNAF